MNIELVEEPKKEVTSKHPTKGYTHLWIKVTLPNVSGMILGKFSIQKARLEEGPIREIVKEEVIKRLKLDECTKYKSSSGIL